jgi:hypothetical protein
MRADRGIAQRASPRSPRTVVVGEAEVVADLMHQHVGDDGAQRFVVLAQ